MFARWKRKFAAAFAGLAWALRTQDSFYVHVLATIVVLWLGLVLRLEAWRWTAVTIVMAAVWSAELFNTSIEELIKALHPARDERIRRSLDAAAAAVLVLAVGSLIVGLITLGPPLWARLSELAP